MFSTETRARAPRVRDVALLLCASWLVVQNAALLIALTALRPALALKAIGAVIEAAFAVVAPLWLIPIVLVVGGMLALALGAGPAPRARVREERHG